MADVPVEAICGARLNRALATEWADKRKYTSNQHRADALAPWLPIDTIDNAPTAEGPTLRIALEVDDARRAVSVSKESGAGILAPPTETPFRTINARVQGPAGWQVTFFQELETLEQRQSRQGFATDNRRAR